MAVVHWLHGHGHSCPENIRKTELFSILIVTRVCSRHGQRFVIAKNYLELILRMPGEWYLPACFTSVQQNSCDSVIGWACKRWANSLGIMYWHSMKDSNIIRKSSHQRKISLSPLLCMTDTTVCDSSLNIAGLWCLPKQTLVSIIYMELVFSLKRHLNPLHSSYQSCSGWYLKGPRSAIIWCYTPVPNGFGPWHKISHLNRFWTCNCQLLTKCQDQVASYIKEAIVNAMQNGY